MFCIFSCYFKVNVIRYMYINYIIADLNNTIIDNYFFPLV